MRERTDPNPCLGPTGGLRKRSARAIRCAAVLRLQAEKHLERGTSAVHLQNEAGKYMTRVQVIGTAVLSLLLGAPAVSQAQVGEPDLVADGRFQRGSRQGGERQGARREGRQGADRGTFSRGSSPRQGGEGRVRERQGGLTGRVRERAAEQPRTERRSGGDLSRPSRRPDSSRGSYTRPGS